MALRQQHVTLNYRHYALVYIDRHGNLHHELSPSVADASQSILSPEVTTTFLAAAAAANPATTNVLSGPSGIPFFNAGDRETWLTAISKASSQSTRTTISIDNAELLRLYYEEGLEKFHQTNCRALAKSYIKLIEPHKRTHYPYNGRMVVSGRLVQLDPETTKPPWWPSGVTHREPDRLTKAERIRLLVSIICDLRSSHQITAKKLRGADEAIRGQVTPPEQLRILDEIYRVREQEEKFLDGANYSQVEIAIPGNQESQTQSTLVSYEKDKQELTPREYGQMQRILSTCDIAPPVRPAMVQSHCPTGSDPVYYAPVGLEYSSMPISGAPQGLKRKREYSKILPAYQSSSIEPIHNISGPTSNMQPYSNDFYYNAPMLPYHAYHGTENLGQPYVAYI
ncbi:uncharacterized protein N7503_006789 [Penicillium pulvis]|uniref:uncharacterized protein n=1 Tax=Penicillium pulvis TaxID=1562058 RepID=UPI002547825D|nr:uncharacterized protein N7503_006789 [Penicillium pulvis]KAJ5797493.1 hypothetical protein N7503_006789 [Penicillium pulvis]